MELLHSQQILIVEDELRIRNLLRLYLEKEGFLVEEAVTGDTHIKRIREKLDEISPDSSSMINTVWGLGYKLQIH